VTPPLLLKKMASSWPRLRRKHFNINCCVNATRVWIEAIRVLMPHASAKPLAVHAVARNAEARALMNGEMEITQESWKAAGAHLIDVGDPNSPGNEWGGHVVIIFNGKLLVDPSAEQMIRPKLLVPHVVMTPVPRSFVSGRAPIFFALPRAGELVYEARPKDREFASFSGFQLHEGNIEAVRELVWEVRR